MSIIKTLVSQIRSIWLTFINIFSKRETIMYPEKSVYLAPRYRGRVILSRNLNGEERCVACNLCAAVCPVGCISLKKSISKTNRWYPKFFRINFSRCIFCGLCEEACPTAAIQLIPDFELSEYKRQDLVYEKEDLLISGPGKYSDYDFYQFSGVEIEGKKKGNLDYESNPIDVKTLLP
ncbi:MAG: NADH-quinone oxidoreductase subunit NuoI [Buchnera aphidicola (Kaburagia rhusicola rhusicola)]